MARIVGGVATSHVPSIGAAIDHDKTGEAYWMPLFDGVAPLRDWIARVKPDVAIVVYNDHASKFALDVIPTFALGAGAEFEPHDEGYGPRPVPTCLGYPELAWHVVESLVLKESFDVTVHGDGA
jgi:protocatechuate 4,5-dioxygenase beta chain